MKIVLWHLSTLPCLWQQAWRPFSINIMSNYSVEHFVFSKHQLFVVLLLYLIESHSKKAINHWLSMFYQVCYIHTYIFCFAFYIFFLCILYIFQFYLLLMLFLDFVFACIISWFCLCLVFYIFYCLSHPYYPPCFLCIFCLLYILLYYLWLLILSLFYILYILSLALSQ